MKTNQKIFIFIFILLAIITSFVIYNMMREPVVEKEEIIPINVGLFFSEPPGPGGTTLVGEHQYIITQGDMTHLNDLPNNWSYGNECGEENFTEGWCYGNLDLKGDCYIRYGKLTVFGEVIYNGFTIDDTECPESQLVIEETLDLTERNSEIFSYYPNPVSDIINIDGPNLKTLDVFNIEARRVLTIELTNQINRLDISGLSSGTYLFRVTNTEGGTETKRIIKD